MGKFFLGLLGRAASSSLGQSAARSTIAAAFRNPTNASLVKSAWSAWKFQIPAAVGFGLLVPGSPGEKLSNITTNLGVAFLTGGMGNVWRQQFWSMAATLAPHFPSMMRGIVSGYRSSLEARTSLAIPFSYSTVGMDQAYATMQYSKSRLTEAYSTVGSEAAFMAAKYMAR